MTTGLKAIETRYNGYRFRSRLEARWAVYFDTMSIDYEYEKEGFDLDGTKYLPDFWLPQVQMWAEVKGQDFTADEEERCRLLAHYTTYGCFLLIGVPEAKAYDALVEEDGALYLRDFALSNYHDYPYSEHRFYSYPVPGDFAPGGILDDVHEGVRAAKSARFEHGERGLPSPSLASVLPTQRQPYLDIARRAVRLPDPVRPTNTVSLPGIPQRPTNA